MFANNILTEEKDSINSQLEIQTSYNDTLVAQNMELARKVEIGGAINVENVAVTAMKMRSNGKYTETNKAQKTDAIKVEFRLIENEIAEPGDKEAYIVLKNPAGQVINAKGTFADVEGTREEIHRPDSGQLLQCRPRCGDARREKRREIRKGHLSD